MEEFTMRECRSSALRMIDACSTNTDALPALGLAALGFLTKGIFDVSLDALCPWYVRKE